MKRSRHTTTPRQFETNQVFYLTCYPETIRLECGPDSAGTLMFIPQPEEFHYDIRGKKFLPSYKIEISPEGEITTRSENQKLWCVVHARQAQTRTMFNSQTPPYCYHWYAVFLKGQRRAPGDKVLSSNVCKCLY